MTHPQLLDLLEQARRLHPVAMDLGLERIQRLLRQLGHPQHQLPPVFHVAGTNGKGSTVAFLRACLEAAGQRVHVYTSPHLVRLNERIRVAGTLMTDDALIALLQEVLDINDGAPLTPFELLTGAALLVFARTPADACILEVGLGGRLDATNVVDQPAACTITPLGLDHTQWLGETLGEIALEKAAIAKPHTPLVIARYPQAITARIAAVAQQVGAPLCARGTDWDIQHYAGALHYRDAHGRLELPLPRLIGAHQFDNAGLAIATLRAQTQISLPDSAFRAGLGWAEWPARLQRLTSGALVDTLPPDSELWLDGGHNPMAGHMLADRFRDHDLTTRPFHLIVGMIATKDAEGFLRPFLGRVSTLWAVPVPDHENCPPDHLAALARKFDIAAQVAPDVATALQTIAAQDTAPPVVLICGSLYLAGSVLAESGFIPG